MTRKGHAITLHFDKWIAFPFDEKSEKPVQTSN